MLWAALTVVVLFLISLVALCSAVLILPQRYIIEEHRPFLTGKPPLVRWLGLIAKNLLGWLLIVIGIVLSVPGIPGQGLLTIFLGLLLVDIPGKRRLIHFLARQPGVLRLLNYLRAHFGRPPLVI